MVKVDFTTGNTEVQSLDGVVTSPNEPVFVPREGAAAEVDGWVLTIWWGRHRPSNAAR